MAIAVLDGAEDVLDGHDGRHPCALQILARFGAGHAGPVGPRETREARLSRHIAKCGWDAQFQPALPEAGFG
jgi:hypothetical protein